MTFALDLLVRSGYVSSAEDVPDRRTCSVVGLSSVEAGRPVGATLTAMSARRISAIISDLRANLT